MKRGASATGAALSPARTTRAFTFFEPIGARAAAPQRAPLVEQASVRDETLASRSDPGDGELASRQLLADVLLGSLRVEAPQIIGLVDLGLAAGDTSRYTGALGTSGQDDHVVPRSPHRRA